MNRRLTRPLLWIALAVPALLMLADYARGAVLAMDLLHPTGELAVRLMIAAMLAGPLAGVFGPNRFFRGWLAIRRNLGVAGFGYAVLHLVFYIADMGADMGGLAAMVDEFTLPPIWTGWLALALLVLPAVTSRDIIMRALGRYRWKSAQRLVYPALALALGHWLLLDWEWLPAALHLAPLALAWLALIVVRSRKRPQSRTSAR